MEIPPPSQNRAVSFRNRVAVSQPCRVGEERGKEQFMVATAMTMCASREG